MIHIYHSTLKLNKKLVRTAILCGFFLISCIMPLQANVIITGVFDGPLTGGQPKGIELFVTADVADLSIYGIGSANNGGGTDGEELTFPAGNYTAGTFIYVTSDAVGFTDFFGFAADFADGVANINGDDAIELFMNGNVIDVFGDINMDGTGTAWEHLDGWAYRNDGSGPDGTTFVENNWLYSGINQLEGGTTNATCTLPFPIGTYEDVMSTTPEFSFSTPGFSVAEGDPAMVEISISIPEDCSIEVTLDAGNSTATEGTDFTFSSPQTLTFTAAGATSQSITIPVTQDTDTEGDETIVLTLQNVAGTGCGLGNVSQLTITISDDDFGTYTIAELNTENADGTAVSAGITGIVTGIVQCVDFDGNEGYDFAITDGTGGITVFSFQDVDGYVVTPGDEISILGVIAQFRGLTQIQPTMITLISQGNNLTSPVQVNTLDESTESIPVDVGYVYLADPSQWGMPGSSFNVDIVNDNGDTLLMRVDSDTDIDEASFLSTIGGFELQGIGGQFSSSNAAYLDGYQIRPCSTADFIYSSVQDVDFGTKFSIFPNPVNELLTIESELTNYQISITDLLGRNLQQLNISTGDTQIDMSHFSNGMYIIIVSSQEKSWAERIIKE